jgi:hypothetical protein
MVFRIFSGSQRPSIISEHGFDTGLEGYGNDSPAPAAAHSSASGGNPGGYASDTFQTQFTNGNFVLDLSGPTKLEYDGSLSFDYSVWGTGTGNLANSGGWIYLTNNTGYGVWEHPFAWSATYNEVPTWSSIMVDLIAADGWQVSCFGTFGNCYQNGTEAGLQQFLATSPGIEIAIRVTEAQGFVNYSSISLSLDNITTTDGINSVPEPSTGLILGPIAIAGALMIRNRTRASRS